MTVISNRGTGPVSGCRHVGRTNPRDMNLSPLPLRCHGLMRALQTRDFWPLARLARKNLGWVGFVSAPENTSKG
jgi:hypothetical protein